MTACKGLYGLGFIAGRVLEKTSNWNICMISLPEAAVDTIDDKADNPVVSSMKSVSMISCGWTGLTMSCLLTALQEQR